MYIYIYSGNINSVCPIIQRSNPVRNSTMGKRSSIGHLSLVGSLPFINPFISLYKSTQWYTVVIIPSERSWRFPPRNGARQEGPEGLVLEEDAGTFWMRFVFLAWHGFHGFHGIGIARECDGGGAVQVEDDFH